MKTFKVSAKVVNIYGNGEDLIQTTYTAISKQKALQGFTEYLTSNKNVVSFSNIKILG